MFRVEILRIVKTPINWIFSVLLPIIMVIILGILFGSEILNYVLVGIIFAISLSGTIIPISINLCSDKVEKRIKHYLIINGAIQKYIIAIYFVNLILFLFVSIIIFLISLIAFKINFDYKVILMLLTFPLISYTIAFMISIILGSLVTSVNVVIPFSILIFYIFLFASGITIPFQNLMEKNQNFYYIEVLTPIGCLYMFYSHVIGSIDLSIIKLVIASLSIILWVFLLTFLVYFSLKSFKK